MVHAIANVNMAHVSNKGCGPAVVDILGGHVAVLFQTLSNVADHIGRPDRGLQALLGQRDLDLGSTATFAIAA